MRYAWLVVALLVAPLSVAAQQDDVELLHIGDDPAGDHAVEVADTSTVPVRWAAADLTALAFHETNPEFSFTWTVASLEADEKIMLIDYVYYSIYFETGGEAYAVNTVWDPESPAAFGYLAKQDADAGFYRSVSEIVVNADAPAGQFTAVVPRGLIVDADGRQPRPGDTIDSFWAHAQSLGSLLLEAYSSGLVTAEDRLPDAGVAPVAWTVVHGVKSIGSARAWSPSPVRVSNGEATTFLFEVALENQAAHVDSFEPASAGGLDSWVVTFQPDPVRLDPGESTKVPVLVTVPFGHDHGAYHPFNVTFQSRTDPLTTAAVELGVRYTAVPQPAGHHDTLWLHQQGNLPFMNTLQDAEVAADDTATAGTLRGSCGFSGGEHSGSSYLVPLSPGLAMGLDFDLERAGTATLRLESAQMSSGYRVAGHFLVWGADRPSSCYRAANEDAVASFMSEPIDFDVGGGEQTIEVNISALEAGDRVPFAAGNKMALLLAVLEPNDLLLGASGVVAPEVLSGSAFQLPLNEYHDDVDDYFSAASGVDLLAMTAQERFVNPGKTVLFEVIAENLGHAEARFDLEVAGSGAEWTDILGDEAITLASGEQRLLAVAVQPPAGTADGETIDVTLHATLSNDNNVRSLIRFLAEVDTDAEHADDLEAAAAVDAALTQDAPAPVIVWLLALALVAAARARRRAASA